jgi:hypothetical protein
MNIAEASDFADLAFQVSMERHIGGKVRANFKADSQSQQNAQNSTVTDGQAKGFISANDVAKCTNKQGAVKPPIVCFECSGPHKKSQCPKLKDKTSVNTGTRVLTCFPVEAKGINLVVLFAKVKLAISYKKPIM